MRVSRTHDNAIDCALAIYLDIVNLFIRLCCPVVENAKASWDRISSQSV